jgi:hypothetical protein
VFSQYGDDGIIQFLVDYLEIPTKTFIEFGVQNYRESNTRFLLINNNWQGLIFDGSQKNIEEIKADNIYTNYGLTAECAFITKENINHLLQKNQFEGEIGLLHIDIDGNDYWIWQEINVISPSIVIMEYNSVFGKDRSITVPYDKSFVRHQKHYSYLYFGASLLALCNLAEQKGYYFIGSNSNGNNAYFIRKDKIKDLKMRTVEDSYVESKFRESRDKNGNFSFIGGEKRLELIKGLPVYNTQTQEIEPI